MFNFSQKDTDFFDMFVESAQCFQRGAFILNEIILNPKKAPSMLEEILKLEEAVDAVGEKIFEKLNLTFITPLDREDILMIANELRAGNDLLQDLLQLIIIYRAGHKSPSPGKTRELSQILVYSSTEILKIFNSLGNLKKHQREILDSVHKISDFESKADVLYRDEIKILFDENRYGNEVQWESILHMIKWKEILKSLEDAQDHCKRLGDMMYGVVIKYA